jgi:multidrug efflux pump subunit AcrA (membrane-fusion protein)
MSAFVRIQIPVLAYVVPRLAVLNPDHGAVVFVVRNKQVHLQYVQVIGRSASDLYINGNLIPGDNVVIRPLDSLRDGQGVTVKQVVH